MTHRDVIIRGIAQGADAAGENVPEEMLADSVLAQMRDAGLVIMPAAPSVRLRHEAVKGVTGITAAAFGTMWQNLVAYARTLER